MDYQLPEDLRARLEAKRLVFTVTTGRSGTTLLRYMFYEVPGAVSYHEPQPEFRYHMRAALFDQEVAKKFWVEEKLPAIATETAPIYVETTHLFSKGFAEPLLDLNIVPDIIILTRPHREVALSSLQLGIIPSRTQKGLDWNLSPEDPGVLALPNWRQLTDYQLCYWYCLETERRQKLYRNLFAQRGAHVSHISLYELRTLKGFRRMLKELDLPMPSLYNQLRLFAKGMIPVNKQSKHKKAIQAHVPTDSELSQQESEVRSLVTS